MTLVEHCSEDPLAFVLIGKKDSLKLYCQAPREDVKQTWTSQITSLLDMQGDFLRGSIKFYTD